MRLSDTTVAKLPFTAPPTAQRIYRDESLRGFLLIVGRKSKSWSVQRGPGRREPNVRVTKGVRKKLGDWPDMDAATARSLAHKILDPKARPTAAPVMTLREAHDRYQAEHLAGHASDRTEGFYRECIEGRLGKWLDKPLAEITRPMLLAKFEELSERTEGDRPGQRRGGKYAANATMRAYKAVYRFAQEIGEGLPDLPRIRLHKETRRNTAMAIEDLAAWHVARKALPNAMRAEFHLLLLLSGGRPESQKEARWSDIDLKARRWHVPDPKGGTDRAYDIPLSGPMLDALKRVRALGQMIDAHSGMVFVQVNNEGRIVEHKEKRSVLSHWGNDLRQTYISAATRLGVPEAMIALLVNHKRGQSVTHGYITRDALFKALLKAQEKISAKLA